MSRRAATTVEYLDLCPCRGAQGFYALSGPGRPAMRITMPPGHVGNRGQSWKQKELPKIGEVNASGMGEIALSAEECAV